MNEPNTTTNNNKQQQLPLISTTNTTTTLQTFLSEEEEEEDNNHIHNHNQQQVFFNVFDLCLPKTQQDAHLILTHKYPLYQKKGHFYEIVFQLSKEIGSELDSVIFTHLLIQFNDYRACCYFLNVLSEDVNLQNKLFLWSKKCGVERVLKVPPLKLKPCCGGCDIDAKSSNNDNTKCHQVYGTINLASNHFNHFLKFSNLTQPSNRVSNQQHYPQHSTTKTTTKNKQLPVIFNLCVIAHETRNIQADLVWARKIQILVSRYGFLYSQSLVNTTLGGAYACLKDANKAAFYAYRQYKVALLLGDEVMEIRSLLYLSYWYIYKRYFKQAKFLISEQHKRAEKIGSKTLSVIATAAQNFLEFTKKEQQQQQSHKRLKIN